MALMNEYSSNLHLNEGLSEREVLDSRNGFGMNVLPPPQRESFWKLYLSKYRDPIIIILIVAALISLTLGFFEGNFIETIGILAAIFLATTIGFVFEYDAARKFNILTQLDEQQPVKVRRNGKVMQIERQDVVVGDVVLIEVGDEIPADGLLLKAVNLQIDESSLTGEQLTNKHLTDDNSDGAYGKNHVLRSSMVMNGRGEFVVIAVGANTEIGKVARNTTEQLHIKTPLNRQLTHLAKRISVFGSAFSIAIFLIFLLHNILTNPTLWHSDNYMGMTEVVLQYFMMAVTLIVMAVPEGLPMAITLALALNMRRMLTSNILVRKLHACETMGAVNVICTDKTGTLTLNVMEVTEMTIIDDAPILLHTAIAANTTAELNGNEAIGNPTETALLKWLQQEKQDYKVLRSEINIIQQETFSTEKKYMWTLVSSGSDTYLFIKGAPEIILRMCAVDEDKRQEVLESIQAMQQKGYRTLAFAYKKLPFDKNENYDFNLNELTLQAFCAIADPIRPNVKAAVSSCQKAGIQVKIVTGDSMLTAEEIAKQLGIWNGQALTGQQWAELSDEEAREMARKICVLSRARPQDKQRLVNVLQDEDLTVAVTGDGTNDAPALHHAHVGLSLGSGTNVAKEASDITVLDDSFLSITKGVMWGRSLYKNIQRFLFFQLVVNISALLVALAGSVLGTELPLTVTQILWVNIIMDTFAAMALSTLPPSRVVMKEMPRRPTDPIVTRRMGRAILLWALPISVIMIALLIYCERNGNQGLDRWELTIFFTTFVMLHFWNLLNAKTMGTNHHAFHNWKSDNWLHIIMLLILLGQWFIVQYGGEVFRTVQLSATEWLLIIACTSPIYIIGEGYRMFKRWKAKQQVKTTNKSE